MPPSISIIGATGAVGSTLAGQILRSCLLEPPARLQLVARGGVAASADHLLSLRIDLIDAFDDTGVEIEVVADLEDIDGEIVIMCAGVSTHGGLIVREEWGKANVGLFEQTSETCARCVPDSLFIIVSNPIELAVKIFSDKLAHNRVIGMGAE
jgi:malate dehydrogenase